MAVFPVIITNTPPASVTITMANYSYAEFKNSLGSFVYKVRKIYLYSDNGNQVNQPMLFTRYDANGNRTYINLTPIISPYQDTNAFIFSTTEDNVILNGLSRLNFMMLANETLILQIDAERIGITDQLDTIAETNYYQVESAMGKKDLFENYKDRL